MTAQVTWFYLESARLVTTPDLSFLAPMNLVLWSGFWDMVGFVAMGYDKHLAVSQWKRDSIRISERTLHEVAFAGGFIGIAVGAKIFHHKTRKPSFWGPVVVALLLWVAIFVAMEPGLFRA